MSTNITVHYEGVEIPVRVIDFPKSEFRDFSFSELAIGDYSSGTEIKLFMKDLDAVRAFALSILKELPDPRVKTAEQELIREVILWIEKVWQDSNCEIAPSVFDIMRKQGVEREQAEKALKEWNEIGA